MKNTAMMTAAGEYFDYAHAADPRQVPDIATIAHHLALQNRFSGCTRVPYSVAQHSISVSYHCERLGYDPLWGLMHDAAEAVMADLTRPAKLLLLDYQMLHDMVLESIAEAYGMVWPIPDGVHKVDNIMLVTEGRDLCHPNWPVERLCRELDVEPLLHHIDPMDWKQARDLFIGRYMLVRPEAV